LLPLEGNGVATPWLATSANESSPEFSPDGQWLAYSSTESGRSEIYVQPVAKTGEKFLISTNGGDFPRWSRDGRELYYSRGYDILAVPVSTRPAFTKGAPSVLFTTLARRLDFDVDREGRFVFVSSMELATARELRVVVNWFDELRRKVGEGR
jgi:Tol biopolymer transport system component